MSTRAYVACSQSRVAPAHTLVSVLDAEVLVSLLAGGMEKKHCSAPIFHIMDPQILGMRLYHSNLTFPLNLDISLGMGESIHGLQLNHLRAGPLI